MGISVDREALAEPLVELLVEALPPDWPSRLPLAPDVDRPEVVDEVVVAGVTVPVSCMR